MSRSPSRSLSWSSPRASGCCFVPPYLLDHLALAAPSFAHSPRLRDVDADLRHRRAASTPSTPSTATRLRTEPAWTVHTADGGSELPGAVVRRAGEPASGDPAVDEAASGITGALALFEEVYGRSSYDDAGAAVVLTVHYEHDYANAFWDGTQLVFGDGDGEVFGRFTQPVDVLGHELTHAVTEHTAGLVYQGQSGALNESVSDVFAACLKQRLLGQGAAEADWLIGEGIFLPGVQARGLRDMAAPGTAYDDPRLGRDPQPGDMSGYVEGTDDNGGVHVNSGIPNRAFQLAAVAIGGSSWEGAGRVWYDALVGGQVRPDSDFAAFAAATLLAAGTHREAVAQAWRVVGVEPGSVGGGGAPAPEAGAGRQVRVRRSGGFAGLTSEGLVDLDAEGPDEVTDELAGLVGRIGPRELGAGADARPMPDMFVYEVDLCGRRATLGEQHLSTDLRRVVELVLERSRER